ncbi:hypothetical protein [Falsibacillus pallidus]|uniref:hypothetical protein n=1 Tax=Falsibacillus pallidus TaxID=493781 RepID=UPI003D96D1B9
MKRFKYSIVDISYERCVDEMGTIGFVFAIVAMTFAMNAESKVKKLEKRVKELEERN